MKRKIICIVIIFILILNVMFFGEKDYTIKGVKYNGDNLKISIDGESSNTLPISGTYYLASYDCESDETKLSWNKESYELNVTNGNKKSGVSCYLDFQTNPLLSLMKEGSYVDYVGNNDCPSGHCDGTNANYVSDTNMGYCASPNYKFITNGWRIAYKQNGSAYLISAGAPECMCTSSNGTISDSSCSDYETTNGAPSHLTNLDDRALKYCNPIFVNDGVCNNAAVWAMGVNDFKKITGKELNYDIVTNGVCGGSSTNMNCGYNNDLIDNGGYYWLAILFNYLNSFNVMAWSSGYRYVADYSSNYLYGIRPVIYLDSSVVVTDGSGTYEDPYTIGNNTFTINEASLVSDGNSRNITLNLVALDTVTKVCVNVDSSSCSNYVDFPESNTYNIDLSSYGTGERTIYVYYKNANGKVVASMQKNITLS